jgi:hypothetical protein
MKVVRRTDLAWNADARLIGIGAGGGPPGPLSGG